MFTRTLVYDRGIDCIIRQEKEGNLRYLDLQTKARSKDCNPENAGRFAAMDIVNPRSNYFFIFYSEHIDTYWVVPSEELVQLAYMNRRGKNAGRYSINFCKVKKDGTIIPNPEYDRYRNNFKLLE